MVSAYAGMLNRDVLFEIHQERNRQDEKWGEQNHPDFDLHFVPELPYAETVKRLCNAAHESGRDNWALILAEEFLEAFEEAEDGRTAMLRTELIQVAAVCVAWVECIDRRTDG